MDGQQSAQAGRFSRAQMSLYLMGIKIEGVRVDINENGPASGAHDRTGGGEKAEGSRDHAVAGGHSHGSERQPKRIGAGRATDRLRGAREGGQLAFERLDFRTENEMLRGADPFHSGQNLFANGGVLAAEGEPGHSRFRGHGALLRGGS